MAYTPDPFDTAQPTGDKPASSAAEEFRAFKASYKYTLRFPAADADSYLGELPAAASRAGKFLMFNATTGKPEAGPLVTSSGITDASLIMYQPAGAGSVVSTVRAKLREIVSVKDFGAVGDGVANDTAAFQLAITAITSGSASTVYVPAGIYKITDTLTLNDKFASFRGDGVGVSTILFTPPTQRTLFDMTLTKSYKKSFSFSDLTITTDLASCGTCFKITTNLTADATQVNGATDTLFLSNIRVVQSGSGYWTKFLHTVNTGGVHAVAVAFNNEITAAQYDVNTVAIHLQQTDSRVSCIRTLTMTDLYVLRTYVAIHTDSIATTTSSNHIESVYLTSGEIVGIGYAALKVTGMVGAVAIANLHVDTTRYAIYAYGAVINFLRIIACDFRQSTNGGTYTVVELLKLGYGEMLSITGTALSGFNDLFPGTVNYVVNLDNTFSGAWLRRMSITGCTIRAVSYVYGTTGAARLVSSGNAYGSIGTALLLDSTLDTDVVGYDTVYTATTLINLDTTGDQTVDVAVPDKFAGSSYKYPVAILQQASSSGTDLLNVSYLFDTSTSTVCKFRIRGNTVTRSVRFSLFASGMITPNYSA